MHGWHRALKMWSRINRGTHECPGLVFCMLAGGSCRGMAYRIDQAQGEQALARLWEREMPIPVYEPRWLLCHTPDGPVRALAFTLARSSPSHTRTNTAAYFARRVGATAARKTMPRPRRMACAP